MSYTPYNYNYIIVFPDNKIQISSIKMPKKHYEKGTHMFEIKAKEPIDILRKFIYDLNCNINIMWNYIHDIKKIW